MVPGRARAEIQTGAAIRVVAVVLAGMVVLQAMDLTQVLHPKIVSEIKLTI